MFSKKSSSYNNPIENYLREVRLTSLFNGYNLANGVVVDPYSFKEVLKEEMRRVEEYLASKEEMTLTRILK